MEHRVHDLGVVDVAAGEGVGLAVAARLGTAPNRVCKTLVVDLAEELAVAVVPVDRSLDLKATAAAFGAKRAAMADPAVAERATGYVTGGISPLGQRRRLRTAVDASIVDHPTVFVSAGRRGLELELAPADVVALTDAVVADIGAAGSASPAGSCA